MFLGEGTAVALETQAVRVEWGGYFLAIYGIRRCTKHVNAWIKGSVLERITILLFLSFAASPA